MILPSVRLPYVMVLTCGQDVPTDKNSGMPVLGVNQLLPDWMRLPPDEGFHAWYCYLVKSSCLRRSQALEGTYLRALLNAQGVKLHSEYLCLYL